jgi:methylenetetrahydrofolate reductase (NADPH)
MHMADILARDACTASFEFFPPQKDAGWEQLFASIAALERLAPSFVSVTYGAGGSTRERTRELVLRLRRETSLDPVPHLTCVGHTRAEMQAILENYAAEGVSNILALRGDAPRGSAMQAGDFPHAADLVRFIRAFNESGRHPDARGFGIGVAAFPEGHPETPNTLRLMDHLKAKVDAGATRAISQFFFDIDAFLRFRDRVRAAGITIPLSPGIMPVTNFNGLKRMSAACGAAVPGWLAAHFEGLDDDPETRKLIAASVAAETCARLRSTRPTRQ